MFVICVYPFYVLYHKLFERILTLFCCCGVCDHLEYKQSGTRVLELEDDVNASLDIYH